MALIKTLLIFFVWLRNSSFLLPCMFVYKLFLREKKKKNIFYYM